MKMSKEEVMRLLPHRSPMLLVDEVEELVVMDRVRTKFYVDEGWEILRGHFPGEPVMPGVLSVECMAQATDILIMSEEKYASMTPLFAGIDKVRFRKKILPGDSVHAVVRLVEIDEGRRLFTGEAKLLVGEEVAAEALIKIAMR